MDYPTLKLVAHCEEDPAYEQMAIKEYLIYKMYNELTDNSFRSQLVKITYCDSEKKQATIERFGLLLEHNRELADRMDGKVLGANYGTPKQINLPAYKVFAFFQYMIGNTDWGFSNRHNVKLVQPNEGDVKLPIPIPYDFDFCGLVNAPYAIPHHNHPINNVRERFFQWRGGETDFSETIALFKNKKERLLGLVDGCPYLTDEVKADAVLYLLSFFDELETPEVIVGAEGMRPIGGFDKKKEATNRRPLLIFIR